MKKSLVTMVVLMAVAGFGYADDLEVLGSPTITPLEGDFTMVVNHDNTSAAYVQDNSPDGETIYRYEFLFHPNQISPENGNWRQGIFAVNGDNPRPNNASNACPNSETVKVPVVRVFFWTYGGSGQLYSVKAIAMSNQCGVRGTARVNIPSNEARKICGYVTTGSPGEVGLTAVGVAEECPSYGAGYATNTVNNVEHAVVHVRLGTLGTNVYNVGEDGPFYFDSFASFRTLAP